MIMQASGLGMVVGRFSIRQREVGVLAMLDAGLNTTRHIEDPPGDGVQRLLVTSMAVGVFSDCHC